MKVLIAGGFGYVGARVAQFLAFRSGYTVVLGSRRALATPAWLRAADTVQLHWNDDGTLERACAGVDAVVHAAGMHAQACREDPVGALAFNGVATARLLAAAERQGVRRFIYVSTAHVYGAMEGVVTEATCPASIASYATSHRAGEDVVRAFLAERRSDAIAVRLSNAYGAPVDSDTECWDLVLNDLCRQAVARGRMVLRSSGIQRRNFVPIDDAAASIDHLLRVPASKLGTGVFNVGSAWSPTLREAAGLIQERCASVLGHRPILQAPPPSTNECTREFEYRCAALRDSGFKPAGDHVGAIDALLAHCHSRWGTVSPGYSVQ